MTQYRLPEPSDLPPPSAELVLWRVSQEALISVLGRRKADKYLRTMRDALAGEENLASVFQIRPASSQGAVKAARMGAAAMFLKYLPILLARLPPA